MSSVNSTFGDNYRYLSFKYNIRSHIWFSSLNEGAKCISLYISIHEHALYSSHGDIIRDLCLARDDYHHPEHLLSCNEIRELIEYLCINLLLKLILFLNVFHPRFLCAITLQFVIKYLY